MRQHRHFKWLPFYMLFPLTAALLFLDDKGQMSDTWRMIILGLIVVLICALAGMWIERHPRLEESERVDSLRGHHPLARMTPYWEHGEDGLAPEEDDVRFTPVRHSRSDE